MDNIEYFEVEGAVLREVAGKLELYIGAGQYKPYQGDADRIYRQSNPMTLAEVKPHMDITDAKVAPAK